MKLVSYEDGGARWGLLKGTEVIEGERLLGGKIRGLRQLLEQGLTAEVAGEADGLGPGTSLDKLILLPVIPDPGKVFCVGLNYANHAAETGKASPEHPRIFSRSALSLTGHGRSILRPRASDQFDFEGELAVIIGKAGRHISEAQALDHVAGYACFMDGSIRDWQKHSTTAGKNFETTGSLGPALVTADDVPNSASLELITRLNGGVVQQANTAQMIHTIPALIKYLSTMVTLSAGDVICTGTPDGVGSRRVPPLWMQPGDEVEVEITGVGLLRNQVEAEA